MYKIQFWKSWPAVYQRLLLVIAVGLTLACMLVVVAFFQYPYPLFGWEQLQEVQHQPLPIHTFRVDRFDFTVFAENQILFERWATTTLRLNLIALDVYFGLFILGIATLLAILTVIPRFWFLAGAGMAVFMISTFQLEALRIFGLENKVPSIIMMVILLGITLYYQYLQTAAPLIQRFAVVLAAVLGIGFIINQYSQQPNPLRHLAVNTQPTAIVLTAIFIIMVAHEIMAGFVSLVGQGTRNPKSLQHYLIISGIYLINLWIAYWNKIGWIDWGLIIQPVLLLSVSGVLAVWGIRQRQPQYEQIVSSDPYGVYFIMAMGTIALSLGGYFLATANDVSLLALNDIILYAHIGYGMMFLMYMASNFLTMLSTNFPVQKVLYKPTVMPYFSYRMAGLIFTLALLFYNSWMVPVNHFISGYYTSLGDLYASEDREVLAMGYYKSAHLYAPYNQHSATALAQWEESRENRAKQKSYLKDANDFKPTEFTLINEANAFSSNKLEEILALQEARQKLPLSGVVKNNLGIAYARLGLIDSAYRYFSRARAQPLTEASAEMNLLGLMAEYNLNVNPDSIYQLYASDQPRIQSNTYAIANRKGKQIDLPVRLPEDSLLNLFSASLIGNYIINHLSETDTTFLSQSEVLARNPSNESFKENILVPVALACYTQGQVNRAFRLLEEINTLGNNKGAHSATLGLWALEQGKPELASYYLQTAANRNPLQAGVANAVAIAEMGNLNMALVAWDTLRAHGDAATRTLAESMKRVLAAPPSWLSDFTDLEKFQYARYKIEIADSIQFEKCIALFRDEDLKANAILDRARKWFLLDEVQRASRYYARLQGLHLVDRNLFEDIRYFELRLLSANGQWPELQKQILSGITFGPYRETERIYYEALQQAVRGDTVHAARNFRWVARNNYYFDDGVVAAASYLGNAGDKEIYSILSEALQVNPNSVRILKAYVLSAQARGFELYASSALERLQRQISPAAFRQFVSKNQLSALLLQ